MPRRRTDPGENQTGNSAVAWRKLTPLAYLLQVLNDPTASTARRDRAATCAMPYCHPRMSDQPKGKKRQQAEAAKAAAASGWGGDLDADSQSRQ
jgi:hypothetical protein